MANAVVVFEVSSRLSDVIHQMTQKGYFTVWLDSNTMPATRYLLPNNTVWRPNTELKQGYNDLLSSVTEVNLRGGDQINLLKCIVLNSTPWEGLPST